MTMAQRRHSRQDKLYTDCSASISDPFRRHLTTYTIQYGGRQQSAPDDIAKDLLPYLLRRQVLPGKATMPKLWRETLHGYKHPDYQQAANRNDDYRYANRFDYTQSHHSPPTHRTRHASRFQKARIPVDLAIPPQQLDRDQSVVYDRHMPDSREGRLKTANIYTAVTRRSVPGSDPPTFDALNREMVPVPQLMDRESPKATAYNKVSITPWRNQVTKVVPDRLAVSIPASGSRTTTDSDNAFRLDYLRMPETTFLPVDRSPPKRHYVIDPEWYSERPNMSFVKPGHGPLSW